ncbi:MAG: alanine--tRNA ligase [Pseudonocardiales bacterium]|nr:MAG: alanine--tRNA ligase [Pseudonocardiales bacterium]
MRTADIRRRFLDHFVRFEHTVVPSASLIADDPTLLLVNAGMVPFKPYLLGERTPPHPRATSVQKCVRTVDIEDVGKFSRYGSFFQMCGNFSFGDYFKEGAIHYAWDLLTTAQADGGYGFDAERLWATVYLDDDEAYDVWTRQVGMPPERVQRLGKEDNYWDMGVPGPCGPDSEIFIDRGPENGPDGGPAVGGDRFVELWNLVFMTYERGPGEGKDYPILRDLPARNIDTGMGLERVATQLQGVDNLYEIDEVYPVLARAADLAGKRYGADPSDDVRLRVVADHVRTTLMMIGDGVTPANEGRGYVLRRILRRAVRAMRLLGYDDLALPDLLPVSRDCMSPSYPELAADFERISSYAYAEEEAFRSTLRAGTTIFDSAAAAARSAGSSTLPGDKAFALHDTYGFPIDLTLEMAREQGLTVDEEGFRRLMAQQRTRAKEDSRARKTGGTDVSAYRAVFDRAGPSTFTGYSEVERESAVVGIIGPVGALSGADEGDEVEVVLDATPFYAEGGGQLADLGRITVSGGELEVLDVQSPVPGLIVHRARLLRGELRSGDQAHAAVDVERRRSISRSHTATHLVHRAMRGALGESATQAGSLNAPGRLRFDFNTPAAVPSTVLADVEDQVNAVLLDDLPVRAFVTTQDEARRIGAMALFGEKYGDQVRVVEVGDYARELCGGTHAARSGQIGVIKLLSEASIGAGVRRVEALVGLDAFRFLAREHVLVAQLAEMFKVPADEVPDRVHGIVSRLRDAEKELAKLRADAVLAQGGELATAARDVHGVAVVTTEVAGGTAGDDLRRLALDIRGRLDPGRPAVVAVAAGTGGRASIVVAVNGPARAARLSAADIVREAGQAIDGRGGGSDELAQGGGTNAAGVPEALRLVTDYVAGRVTGTE